ncbi:hypothetical protein HYC85_001903 [Camellia sinensis]|uniref:VHS domain-containing protein n=1 Tax=Camellia sinensis TaxID=4442 RepID=A0A7J7I8H8_CAMSI|nr:hypothetical protein HYC85_001903 [Camellia sinensis]
MAADLVNSATSEKLTEMDWTKNIEICELVARDQRQAKDVIKAIKKRLGSKNSNTQLFAVMLLEMLMNNIGENVHKQVIDTWLLPILVKIVKKKTDLPIREKIFLLLDATQTSLGGASGKFPQYYSAYYDLVGYSFLRGLMLLHQIILLQMQIKIIHLAGNLLLLDMRNLPVEADPQTVPESSIVQKAASALGVLREVLDAVDTQHPEGAKDEFTLDLVEQCSFQKQRLMHLVMTSRDEKVVSRAIDLNEQLQKQLARHDVLISGRPTSTSTHFVHEEAEGEEEAEQLFRRIRKGKACAQPEDEERQIERPFESQIPPERLNRPLIRPLISDPSEESNALRPAVVIPPPPAKHIEREKFFQENKADGSGLAGHVRGLSLHSRNGSTSYSGSIDSD